MILFLFLARGTFLLFLVRDVYSLDTSSGHVLEDAEVNLNECVHDYHRLIYEQRPSTHVILSLKTPATLAFSSLSNLNLSMASKFACRFESESNFIFILNSCCYIKTKSER